MVREALTACPWLGVGAFGWGGGWLWPAPPQPTTAPTTLCSTHVAAEGVHPFRCAKCGKLFSEIAAELSRAVGVRP